MLVVNLETEVDMGINRAPLGRLVVELAELNVLVVRVDGVLVDEDVVAAFCMLSCVLPLREIGTASVRVVVSDTEKLGGLGNVVERGDAEADDDGNCVGTREGVGG